MAKQKITRNGDTEDGIIKEYKMTQFDKPIDVAAGERYFASRTDWASHDYEPSDKGGL